MICTNLHIYPSDFQNESRIMKITNSLISKKIVDQVILIGRGRGEKKISNKIYLYLFSGLNNPIQGIFIIKLFRFFIWYIEILFFLRNKNIQIINAHSISVLPLAFFIYLQNFGKSIIIYDTHELETETTSLSKTRTFR